MKKILNLFLLALLIFSPVALAADLTETLTFEWDIAADQDAIKDWRMKWGTTAGGPYAELGVIDKAAVTVGSEVSAPVEAVVTGQPGTHETRFFVLVACGDIAQADGTTKYECSENSNEVNYKFWIPAASYSVPVNFRIKASQ